MKKEIKVLRVFCVIICSVILLSACSNTSKYAKTYRGSSDGLLNLEKNGDAYYYDSDDGTYIQYSGEWKIEKGQLKINIRSENGDELPLFAELDKDSTGFVLESKLSVWDWSNEAFSEIEKDEMERKLQESDKIRLRWTSVYAENALYLTSDVKSFECPLSEVESKNPDFAKSLLSQMGSGEDSLADVEQRLKAKLVSESGKNGGDIILSIGENGVNIFMEKNPDINSLQNK